MSEWPETHAVRKLLDGLSLGAKKRWGQNFLSNPETARRIVDLAAIGPEDVVWEVGPGLGILTERLLDRGASVVAFEIDWGLIEYLNGRFADRRLEIVPGDAVKELPRAREEREAPTRFVSNLPYSSAATILGRMTEAALWVPLQVVTVQREVADRMVASPGSKDYSSFSVLMQSVYYVSQEMQLSPGVFFPVPEVDSTVVALRLKPGSLPDPAALSRLARGAFAARRKTIRNNLLAAYGSTLDSEQIHSALAGLQIDPGTRAERVSVEQFVALSRRLG